MQLIMTVPLGILLIVYFLTAMVFTYDLFTVVKEQEYKIAPASPNCTLF